MSQLQGYSGKAKQLLERAGVKIGDEIRVVSGKGEMRGILMARYELADPDYIVIKLRNGYNVGIRVADGVKVEKIADAEAPAFRPPPPPAMKPNLPRVAIVSTGGTIASRVDYRTGGVRAALSAADLLSIVPELADIAQISAEILFSVYSENLTISHWRAMAEKVNDLIRSGEDGVVIAHGTDTMGYTAAALSFALQNPPIPVVLVGAQRSSDRPSSDAATNLIAAVDTAANAPFGEVVVCMHKWHSDDTIAIHRGVRVVKLHTSSRDAFKSINAEPLAFRTKAGLVINDSRFNKRGSDNYQFSPTFDDRAMLVKFYPGMPPETLQILREKLRIRGFILEGTGLGHVSSSFIPVARQLVEEGVFIGMTSQCKFGRVNMYVYDNGRDLMRAGITPLDDMLAETALVKLMWSLGKLGENADREAVAELMTRNLVGEMNNRSMPTGW